MRCIWILCLMFPACLTAGNGVDHAVQWVYQPQSIFGSRVFFMDVGTITGSQSVLGIEVLNSRIWVTAGGLDDTAEPNYVFEIDFGGTLQNTFVQPTISTFGWRDLATDGTFLYGSDSAMIEQINTVDGQPTGVQIPVPAGAGIGRALAYDAVSGHFWLANFSSDVYEIDMAGNIINQFANAEFVYGMAFDRLSPTAPRLWLWHQSIVSDALAIDPLTGLPTGAGIFGDLTLGAAGGVTVSDVVQPGWLLLLGIHQTNDVLMGYELFSDLQPVLPRWFESGPPLCGVAQPSVQTLICFFNNDLLCPASPCP